MPLEKRLNGHIYAYNRYINSIKNGCTSSWKCFEGEYMYIYNTKLLENFPCDNKNKFLKR